MGKILAILFCILFTNLSVSYGQNCNNFAFSSNAVYATCVSLPVLNSHLHWNYHTNGTVDVAFRHTGSTTNQWVAWALNIDGSGMIGAQALVALTASNGSVQAYTSSVTSFNTCLQASPLSFQVPMITSERVNGDVVIYATLVFPRGGTRFNQVWQVGPVNNGAPGIHGLGPNNRASTGSVDFSTGQTAGGGSAGGSRMRKRNTHGVLNAVSWGVLMPVGAMTARYLKDERKFNRLGGLLGKKERTTGSLNMHMSIWSGLTLCLDYLSLLLKHMTLNLGVKMQVSCSFGLKNIKRGLMRIWYTWMDGHRSNGGNR